MNKAVKYGAGRTRIVISASLGLISYFALLSLLSIPLLAWF